ncbi:MAG: hypothetical protein CFE21_01540 [Bacteroidetes bacterium B1(2017)]|nr:MAG: hypothetical protein CFE21_01540 [Bacteroidetes bacterium B1(2017)]
MVLGQNKPYLFSYQIDSLLSVDSTNYKFQTASWNFSFIGDYKKSLEVKDLQFPNAKPSTPTQEQIEYFKKFKAIDARKAILEEAKKTQILIINEAHHVGLHRVYLASLLEDLHKIGYTYIGLEALSYEDTLLNQRKYPVLKSGFYTKEPCFGNLIREGIELGYTIFPYEQVYSDSIQKNFGREKAEAVNVKKILDQNPKAKLILYCGYDHVAEDTLKNFMGLPMAGQLKKLTGINPFTIDQTALTEYKIVGSRYRQLMNEKKDVLFVDSNSTYFNKASFPKAIDCNVYHPSSECINGRPTWLRRKNTKFIMLQEKVTIAYPYLIKIYLATDDIAIAVPIDIIELKSPNEKVASLILKHKKQIAIAENNKGEQQIIKLN